TRKSDALKRYPFSDFPAKSGSTHRAASAAVRCGQMQPFAVPNPRESRDKYQRPDGTNTNTITMMLKTIIMMFYLRRRSQRDEQKNEEKCDTRKSQVRYFDKSPTCAPGTEHEPGGGCRGAFVYTPRSTGGLSHHRECLLDILRSSAEL